MVKKMLEDSETTLQNSHSTESQRTITSMTAGSVLDYPDLLQRAVLHHREHLLRLIRIAGRRGQQAAIHHATDVQCGDTLMPRQEKFQTHELRLNVHTSHIVTWSVVSAWRRDSWLTVFGTLSIMAVRIITMTVAYV